MKKVLIIAGVIAVGGIMCLQGCSKETRDEAMSRLSNAGQALNGEADPDDKEHETPNIVAKQQRKERIRQNTKWTAENQVKYPVEYCQAMLEEVAKISQQYEVVMHKCLTAKSSVVRQIAEDDAQLKNLEVFLVTAKKAYRDADASGKWPATVNNFALSKEKLQEKIVDAAGRIKTIQSRQSLQRTNLARLEKKVARVSDEQRKLVETKESLQRTLNNLNLKKVIDSEGGIRDSIAAINDALGALGENEEDVSLDDLIVPNKDTACKETFDAIMSE